MNDRRLQDQLGHIIASVSRQLEEELEERLRPDGVPIEQVRVLEVLAKEGRGCFMREIADAALVDPPTMTKIIDRMVSGGLVFRSPSPNDRRLVVINLAPAGKALHARVGGVVADQETRLAQQLAGDKAEELRALLRQILST